MTLDNQEISRLLNIITNSLRKVYELDRYLIQIEAHERTIVGRFAIYFQEGLKQSSYSDYNMDVEYNRIFYDSKKSYNFPNGLLPDVVVHKRGNSEHNLCVIEFKTGWGENIDRDLSKLKDYTSEDDDYKYGIGYSITINHDYLTIQQVKKGLITGNPIRNEVLI